ncbi:MAG: SGNH/GDSL hydrolase family protein [Ferruginibacter sp.]|nr:SGNH/GDSL hydrolase family protein [Ferruginibacter sp.]
MFKKIIFSILIFVVAGELLIRFDEAFEFMSESRVVKIETSLKITPEYDMVKNNSINVEGNNFRLMVLGDSYIHGGGIEFKDNFSQQLKILLNKANSKFDEVYVLDVSKPSSNNFDNSQTYFQFVDKFKPNVVVLGYNYNDVMGELDKERTLAGIDSFSDIKASSAEKESFIKKVYNIVYQSRFVFYVLHNLHDELKAHGYIVPNSSFDLNLKSYYLNRANWIKSQALLQELIADTEKKNIQLMVLKFPEINLLEYPGIFTKADTSINNFFARNPSVDYIDGTALFNGEKSKDNILSRYDGHPNEKAHKKMAREVFNEIKKITASRNDFNKQ